jgi:hypothetical protein
MFEQTAYSLVRCCQDLDLITHVYVYDDRSPEKDRLLMEEIISQLFPKRVCRVFAHQKGHAHSLNLIQSTAPTELAFCCEDDWEFVKPGSFIRDSLEILNSDLSILQVAFSLGAGWYVPDHGILDVNQYRRAKNVGYYEWHWDGSETHRDIWETWPHFTLNPHVQNLSRIKDQIGPFIPGLKFEERWARRYAKLGFRTAFLPDPYVRHLGEVSAYALNCSEQ